MRFRGDKKVDADKSPYEVWLDAELGRRSTRYPRSSGRLKFSVITPVYQGTDLKFFRETAESLVAQTYPNWEWAVVADGPIPSALQVELSWLRADSRIQYLPHAKTGIIGTMRQALLRSLGDYVIPVDGDDLITPDALAILASQLEQRGLPAFLYSDEDHLIQGRPAVPYFRPDWDPVMNVSSSFVWHLIAFNRKRALELGVYTDAASNWCQDWDTVFRFVDAGETPVHVPEVLYHWRQHEASSTNQANPVSGSLTSQKHVLQTHFNRHGLSESFELAEFPIFRGAKEWWPRYRRQNGESISTVVLTPAIREVSDLREAVARATADLVLVIDETFEFPDEQAMAEAEGQFRQHADCALISGRILDREGRVRAGGEIFGVNGTVGVVNSGAPAGDAGMFALYLKARSVSAVNSRFFFARKGFLDRVLAEVDSIATLSGLGTWLGAAAVDLGRRVVFSPIISTIAPGEFPDLTWGPAEEACFLERHGTKVPDTRWYLPHAPLEQRTQLMGRAREIDS